MSRKVVILQEHIPEYRVAFFDALHEDARREDIELVVACGKPSEAQSKRSDIDALNFIVYLRQREWSIFGRRIVMRRVKEAIAGADLIILEQARRNLEVYPLLALPFRQHRLIALWGHGRDYTKPTRAFERSALRWLTSRADWFFAYTEGGVDAVATDGYPRAQVTLVQNSIDTTMLRANIAAISKESIRSFSAAHDLRGKTALFVGALEDSKRLPFLLDAAITSHQLDPAFRLLIAGDGIRRGDVEQWASEHSWITYLGPVRGEGKAVVLASAQVLAMPGRVGLVAVDSFAAGLPIVTTNWAWHAPEFEYLTDGHNAVVTADLASAYALKMIEVLRDCYLLDLLRTACIDASNVVTIAAMTQNFLGGIHRALELSP